MLFVICLVFLSTMSWACAESTDRVDSLAAGRLESSPAALRHAKIGRLWLLSLSGANARYRVSIPEDASLQIAFGVRAPDRRPLSAHFSVVLERDGHVVAGTERSISRAGAPWREMRLDLAELAGWSGDLVLRARSSRPDADLVWAVPRLIRNLRDDRPNIVLLSLDTLSARHVGAYGYDRNTTPFLDELSRRAVLFRWPVASSTWTLPSHASMFTGLHPGRHGASSGKSRLADELDLLSEKLWRAGYNTASISGGGFVDPTFGFAQGFDYAHAWDQGARQDQFEHSLDLVERWLGRPRDGPYLLFLHTYQVHQPFTPPEKYRGGLVRHPDMAESWALTDIDAETGELPKGVAAEHVSDLYDAEIRYTDDLLRRLVELLAASGEPTCLVVTSDHGEQFAEHDGWGHGGMVYDEVTHVPLVIDCPGYEPRTVEMPVSLVDIAPTLAELAGVPEMGAQLDGISLVPALSGAPLDVGRAVWVDSYLGPNGPPRIVAARTRDHKLIHNLESGAWELYDLSDDPAEQRNRFSEDHPVVAQLQPYVERLSALRSTPAGSSEPTEVDPELAETLRALGYLE